MNQIIIEPGRYRHYKGNDYAVIGMARHSETHDWMVVYRPLYGVAPDGRQAHDALWVRPAGMFIESVQVAGKTVPRFTRLAETAE